jgi:hypothetical protein
MTTKKQIRQLFLPILKRNRDVVQLDRITIWLEPIRHLACRVTVDRCSNEDVCVPSWHIMDTIEPRPDFPPFGRFGETLYRYGSERRWRWSDPTTEDELRMRIEVEILPFFRAVGTLENYVALQRRHWMWGPNHSPLSDLILDVSLGDLISAKQTFDLLWRGHQNWMSRICEAKQPVARDFVRKLGILAMLRDDLLAENRAGFARTLYAWEAENITWLKAERHWEPTPFPLVRDGEASWPVPEDMVARLEAMITLTPRQKREDRPT